MTGLAKKIISKFSSSKEDKANKSIGKQMSSEKKVYKSVYTCVLLGAGGSGKSTIIKQMHKIQNGFVESKEMESSVEEIRNNILLDILDLCSYNVTYRSQFSSFKPQKENEKLIEQLAKQAQNKTLATINLKLDEDFAKIIDQLWKDKAIKCTLEERKKSQIMDNTGWLFDRVLTIADENYQGSFDDYIRVRHKTTGMNVNKFNININEKLFLFNIIDVGGQRSERRKWFKMFNSDINVVLYIMALSSYNQILFEDHTVKSYDETFEVFKNISQNEYFINTDFIVFLNKTDLFDEKIKTIPFTVYDDKFDDKEKHNGEAVQKYVIKKFKTIWKKCSSDLQTNYRKKYKDDEFEVDRKLSFYLTSATSTHIISQVMTTVQNSIVTRSLKETMM